MIANLTARAEISDLICRLALGMDKRDEAMFADCFADRFLLSVPPLGAGAEPMIGELDNKDHARNVIGTLSQFRATQHVLSNHLIEVDAEINNARCCVYLIGTHIIDGIDSGDNIHTIGARYEFTCSHTPDGWRIVELEWIRHWATGNEGIWAIAAHRAAARQA